MRRGTIGQYIVSYTTYITYCITAEVRGSKKCFITKSWVRAEKKPWARL